MSLRVAAEACHQTQRLIYAMSLWGTHYTYMGCDFYACAIWPLWEELKTMFGGSDKTVSNYSPGTEDCRHSD